MKPKRKNKSVVSRTLEKKKAKIKFKKPKITTGPNYDLKKHGVTQSILQQWLACRLACKYSLQGWRSTGLKVALEFGSLFHNLLEKQYKAIINNKKELNIDYELNKWSKEILKTYPDNQTVNDMMVKIKILWENYFVQWKEDYKRAWVGVETKFDVKYNGVRLRGMRDGLYRCKKTGSLWLLETKTYSDVNEQTMSDRLLFDFQNLFYITATEEELKEDVKGVLYNIIVKPRHRLGKKETYKEFYSRLKDVIPQDLDKYFVRFEVPYGKKRKEHFKKELNNILFYFNDWFYNNMEPTFRSSTYTCLGKIACSFLKACAQMSMTGYERRNDLMEELGGLK